MENRHFFMDKYQLFEGSFSIAMLVRGPQPSVIRPWLGKFHCHVWWHRSVASTLPKGLEDEFWPNVDCHFSDKPYPNVGIRSRFAAISSDFSPEWRTIQLCLGFCWNHRWCLLWQRSLPKEPPSAVARQPPVTRTLRSKPFDWVTVYVSLWFSLYQKPKHVPI